ncbi:MAG: hypothetical protein R3182_03255 [Draconibacterium sp.]|nr:hypothetical protein [Draconibacterium sp.]
MKPNGLENLQVKLVLIFTLLIFIQGEVLCQTGEDWLNNLAEKTSKNQKRIISKKISSEFGFDEIVYVTRRTKKNDGHWYANFSHYAADTTNKLYVVGGQLAKFNLNTGRTTILLEDRYGNFRDPAVDSDGKTIVFSYRKGGEDAYHLWEIQSDGSGLKQLTFGEYDDIEPCFLSDGGIMFVSTRAKRWVQCWLTRVAVLHRCNRDGTNIQQISANVEQDNTPWMLNDGRVMYTRWEYVDRSQVDYHQLWTANPDGTGQMVYFGNMHPGGVFIDAKPIPESDKVVFIFSPGHGRPEHAGRIATVSDENGPDDRSSIEFITEEGDFCDPYALSKNAFLAARRNKLVFLNREGNMVDLYSQPKLPYGDNDKKVYVGIHEPRPLKPSKEKPAIASRIDMSKENGQMMLTNVYIGRNMESVEKGSVKKLLIMESLPKPINYTGGMDPLSYGGTFTLERIIGTVPVEEDGSAYFELPALRSFFFIALDENENSVKRMHSFTSVMPGETFSCVGCHEERTFTPANLYAKGMPDAFKRSPSKIEPLNGIPDVYDFPRDIQPILDKHCIKCHSASERKGGVILTGDYGPMFSQSYFNLTVFKQIADARNRARGNFDPYEIGAQSSELMKKIDGSHHDVKLSTDEIRTIRFWIEAGGAYPGTYAALGGGAIGGYYQNMQLVNNDSEWPESLAAKKAIEKRCLKCHKEDLRIPENLTHENGVSFWRPENWDEPALKRVRHMVFNLTNPENSVMLLGPLSKEAGGYGACKEILADGEKGNSIEVFKDKNDNDYQAILKMIHAGKNRLQEVTRFDMANFKPHPAYIREMKKYGILPKDFNSEKETLDVYQLDRKYWDSFIYKPQ